MNAILLSPGPSLVNYQPKEAGLTVCINRAATLHKCDVWACGDPPSIQHHASKVIGKPMLLTSTDGLHVVQTFKRDFGEELWDGHTKCWAEMVSYCPLMFEPGEPGWIWVTALGALMYCGYAGATRVDCYGVDWNGTKDWDGVEAGKNRSDARWAHERALWENRLVPFLEKRGCEVVRH